MTTGCLWPLIPLSFWIYNVGVTATVGDCTLRQLLPIQVEPGSLPLCLIDILTSLCIRIANFTDEVIASQRPILELQLEVLLPILLEESACVCLTFEAVVAIGRLVYLFKFADDC